MSQPEANAPVDVKSRRRRRRAVFLVVALGTMGFLWWMGQPFKPYGEPDAEELALREAAARTSYIDEFYAEGKIRATARVSEDAEPAIEVVQVGADAADLGVEVNFADDRWKEVRELTPAELEAAGFKHGLFSQGARHQMRRFYELAPKRTGELTIAFNSDEKLESLTVNAITTPPVPIAQPPAKLRIAGKDVPLPMQKSEFVQLFGEPGPPPESPRRGRRPQADPQPEAVNNAGEIPTQESSE